ncbi:MAG: hypothetical protein HYS98_02865 [Deltaproteobacteria bacterium]|nr:hypothetical protein [Deltaproteobacteria bacterium]
MNQQDKIKIRLKRLMKKIRKQGYILELDPNTNVKDQYYFAHLVYEKFIDEQTSYRITMEET